MHKKAPSLVDAHVGSRVRMRRHVVGMSQTKLADEIGLTFQQVQKYEKGSNRMGASRLAQIASALQVPVPYFFEGAPGLSPIENEAVVSPSTAFVAEFLSSEDGVALVKAFIRIKQSKMRRRIVELVEEIAAGEDD